MAATLLFLASSLLHLTAARIAVQAEGIASAAPASRDAAERGRLLAQRLHGATLNGELAMLAARLPPGVALAEASLADGALTIAVDTRDPDTMRATLAADPLLARFVARGQSLRDDGTIRAVFTRGGL